MIINLLGEELANEPCYQLVNDGEVVSAYQDGELAKTGSDCGANAEGGGGFQPGNTCGSREGGDSEGSGGSKQGKGGKVYEWALKKFKDEETARNFTKWFGDSKVVDQDGNPLRVYHGTDADFLEFNGGDKNLKGAVLGTGHYFTDNPNRAAAYAGDGPGANTKPVYLSISNPMDLDSEITQEQAGRLGAELARVAPNRGMIGSPRATSEPMDKEPAKEFYNQKLEEWKQRGEGVSRTKPKVISSGGKFSVEYSDTGKVLLSTKASEAFRDIAFVVGPDSSAVLSKAGFDGVKRGDEYVAFSPTQIKSATGNSGKFDPSSGDITKSSDCGANGPGGGGFQPGNTCGKEDGAEGEAKGKEGKAKPQGVFANAREAAKADLERIRSEVIKTAEEWAAKIEEAKKVADAEFDKIAGATEPMQRAWDNMAGKTGEEKSIALQLYEAESAKFDLLRGPANEAHAEYLKMKEKARIAIADVLGKESLALSESLGITDKHEQTSEENSRLLYGSFVVSEHAQILKDPYSKRSVTSGTARAERIAATAFLSSMLHPVIHESALRSEIVYQEYGGRASAATRDRGWNEARQSYDDNETGYSNIPLDANNSTYIHEYGHQVEFGSQEIRNLTLDFLASRIKGEEIISFNEKYSGSGYNEWERGAKDGFAKAHEAAGFAPEEAERKAYYVGKTYGTRATELLSMGLELMHKDAAAFAKADPEWFDLVAGIATGRLLPIAQKRLKDGK